MRAIDATYPGSFDSEKSRPLLREIGFEWGLLATLELFYPGDWLTPIEHITPALLEAWRDAVREVLEDGLHLPFTEQWAGAWASYLCEFMTDALEDGPPPDEAIFLHFQKGVPKLSDYRDDLQDAWELNRMSEKGHDALVLERARRYRKDFALYAEKQGFVKAKLPTDPRHYKWLAMACVGGDTVRLISKKGFHGSDEITEQAIRKGVREAAKRCGLESPL